MKTLKEATCLVSGRSRRGYTKSAFTLIELLVVIAIIGLLAGVIGLSLRDDSNSSSGLRAAQSTLSSLLSSVRGQAALTGGTAALFVSYDTTSTKSDRYLRYCVVATTPDNPVTASSTWTPVNDGYYLPKGVYILPKTTPSGSSVETGVSYGTLASSGFDQNTITQKFNDTTSESWLVFGMNALGQRVAISGSMGTGTYIILSVANPQPPSTVPPIKFSNGSNVCGFSISQYGVAGLINNVEGFQ